MKTVSLGLIAVFALATASPVVAQEPDSPYAGLLFAMGGVHYHVRESLSGGLAENETLANLRGELGVGMLARDNPNLAPFVYGGDFRFLLSFAQLNASSAALTDVPLRGAFGAQFGEFLVAATAGPGMYTAFLTSGGDATRVSVGYEIGLKAIFTWGLYGEASFVAPEGLAVLQDSQFLDAQPAGLRVGLGFNFLSATPEEVREMSAEASQ